MIHDITPVISEDLAVWPGDVPLTRDVNMDIHRGDVVTLSSLRATCHLGAHADAPSHYAADGATMEKCPLKPYVGPCQVIRVSAKRGGRIEFDDLQTAIEAPRILIASGTFPDPAQFNEDFAALSPDLIDQLAELGIVLIGVDTPSIDLCHDESLAAHHRCLAHEILIIEGLVLADVPTGTYELIALPLKLAGFDGSPIRAILRSSKLS